MHGPRGRRREPGPRPVVRAVLGLALGLAAGAVVAALVPRDLLPGDPVPRDRGLPPAPWTLYR